MTRWTRVRVVVPAIVVLAAAVVVLASRTWITGTATGDVVGSRRLSVTGGDAAPGLVALALVALAAIIAAATSRRVGRVVSLVLLTLSSVGVLATALRAALGARTVLGEAAARAAGHTGTVPVRAEVTVSTWLAVGCAALLICAAGVAWAGARSWPGLSDRYDRSEEQVAGVRGERGGSDWDRLSAGEDPTDDGP